MIRKFHFIDWKQNRKGKKRKKPELGRKKKGTEKHKMEREEQKIGGGFSLCSILGSNGEEETGTAKKNGFFLHYRIMPSDGVVWLNKKEGLL